MFQVQLPDTRHVVAQLEGMVKKIHELERHGVVNEVRDWETQDVHRKRPGARHTRNGARVYFRPHSRYEMRRHMLNIRRLKRHGVMVMPSTRPILRRVMIDRLWDRMTALVNGALTWQK